MEQTVNTRQELEVALKSVDMAPSNLQMGWGFEIEDVVSPDGWLVNTTFQRPDTHTGAIGTGRGRKEFIAKGTTVRGVAMTAFLLYRLIIDHELLEAFLFKNMRVLDPHNTMEDFALSQFLGTRPVTVDFNNDFHRIALVNLLRDTQALVTTQHENRDGFGEVLLEVYSEKTGITNVVACDGRVGVVTSDTQQFIDWISGCIYMKDYLAAFSSYARRYEPTILASEYNIA